MARKTRKAPVRKAAAKAKTKPAPRPARKKASRKKSARKRATAIQRLENAIEVGVAELDDVAVSMGILGAVEPRGKKPSRKKKR